MKAVYLGLTLAGSLVLGGCVVNVGDGVSGYQGWEKTQLDNREHLTQLSLGMDKSQVLALMGKADFHEAWQADGKKVQVFFYRTHRLHGDGSTTKEECTPVVLHDNRLVGWGETAYRKG